MPLKHLNSFEQTQPLIDVAVNFDDHIIRRNKCGDGLIGEERL